jgi:SAM-dependent methyltransferase
MNDQIAARQRAYYENTAAEYRSMHVTEGDEHYRALSYIASMAATWGISSFLDVGSGTGRAVQFLNERGFHVRGVEPVEALMDQADVAVRQLIQHGRGEALPYPDASFDAVCEFGVLHHVRRPDLVVREMLRVARKAVFLSDANRFGQGRRPVRILKLILSKLGLWPVANLIKTKGKIYSYSEGDGIFYSYSVYDSLSLVSTWAEEAYIHPLMPQRSDSWFQPVLTSEQVLLCAFRSTPLAGGPVLLERQFPSDRSS